MATQKFSVRRSYAAAGDLSSHRHKLVALNATTEQIALAGAGAAAFVLEDDPDAAGIYGSVTVMGVTKVVVGAAINAQVPITPDASGLAVAATSTDNVCGITLETGGGANELVTCLIGGQHVLA